MRWYCYVGLWAVVAGVVLTIWKGHFDRIGPT
jgi:hypothetical protein